MPGDHARAAVFGEAPVARADDENAGQGAGAAAAMHDGGAGEVHKAEALQPAARATDSVGAGEAAPGPVAGERVDDAGEEAGIDEVADEFGALGHGAGDDGASGAGEDDLEEPKAPKRAVLGEVGEPEAVGADPAPGAAAEHEAEAEEHENDDGDGEVQEVFHDDVDAVFGPGEAQFEKAEAGLHEENERAGEDDPDEVHAGLRGAAGFIRGRR